MSTRIPASLAYYLIYNATLLPPAQTARDDEDAQEEAHILFYTSRERAGSRDRMLRQVGLAKALVNFSDIFAPGQGCDNVHSQTKRMVHVSPEPDFWLHAVGSISANAIHKRLIQFAPYRREKDNTFQTYHYHEDSVHNLALRRHLLRGYEAFKLLHGTFTHILGSHGPEVLRAQLERFFTPWAWKWDLETPVEFSTDLGLPLHPSNSILTPIVFPFFNDIPPNATPLLVSPPFIINPRKTLPKCPPSLLAHLLSLAHTQGHHNPPRVPNKKRSSKDAWNPTSNPASGTLGFWAAGGAGMGDALNVKNWSWPDVLTFGKHKAPHGYSESTEPDNAAQVTDRTEASSSLSVPTTHATEDSQVILNDPIAKPLTQPLDGLHTDVEDREPGVTETTTDASLETQHTGSEVQTTSPLENAQSPSSPQNDSIFSVFETFVSEPSDPLVVERRSVLYLMKFQLVFALLMDVDWHEDVLEQSLLTLRRKAPDFLRDVRRVIDTNDNSSASPATDDNKKTFNRVKHVISTSHSAVSLSEKFASTNSQFFEGQGMLARDTDRIEIFSRTAPSQHWFVARQGLGQNSAGERVAGEAYVEVNNKDASLVDADNELIGAVRRWGLQET